jgi:hypothetical protein
MIMSAVLTIAGLLMWLTPCPHFAFDVLIGDVMPGTRAILEAVL